MNSQRSEPCNISLFFFRNIRPIFRTCLISLACSDIITVTFVFVAYVAQMTSDYQSTWVKEIIVVTS